MRSSFFLIHFLGLLPLPVKKKRRSSSYRRADFKIKITLAKGDDGSAEYIEQLTHAAKTFFDKADVDGDGTISPLEFAKTLKIQGKTFAKRGHS